MFLSQNTYKTNNSKILHRCWWKWKKTDTKRWWDCLTYLKRIQYN